VLFVKRIGVLLIMIALIAGMEGCIFGPSTQNLQIRTWYDLEAIRDNLSGHHTLMNDLNSTTAGYQELASPTANEGKGWHPLVGEGGDPPFTGTFDGQGYEIRDVSINLPGIGYVGLFSILGEGGRIEDVGVVNAEVNSTAYIGCLVGINLGTVSNSYCTGRVKGSLFVGGLVGYNQGSVSNSYSAGNVTSDNGAGGLAGGSSGTISNSYATGGVTGWESAGGLVGTNNGTVVNCYSVGNVTGNVNIGGLAGYSQGNVTNSFWDIQTSGQATSSGGTGKTTAQMRNIATFSAWNITAVANPGLRNLAYIWNIVNNTTYPFLSWKPV
jgi:The GLUG motif